MRNYWAVAHRLPNSRLIRLIGEELLSFCLTNVPLINLFVCLQVWDLGDSGFLCTLSLCPALSLQTVFLGACACLCVV